MMQDSGNRQIRRLFEVLRQHDREVAPPLEQVLEGKRFQPAAGLPAAWAAAALAVLAVALWLGFSLTQTDPAPSLSAWKAPTDFLLRIPGEGLMAQPRVLDWTAVWGSEASRKALEPQSGSSSKEKPEK